MTSVRRLKGEERPVNDEESRAIVLGGLGAVDMVMLFGAEPADADKPLRLIQAPEARPVFQGRRLYGGGAGGNAASARLWRPGRDHAVP